MTSTYSTPQIESSTLHEPFLERAADTSTEDPGNNGLGAFLTLRLIDQFSADRDKIQREATAYQVTATSEFLNDIYPETPEVTHLRELVRVAGMALDAKERRLLLPPLMAFAYWLEEELRLDESLDVLTTALRLSDGRNAEEEVAAHLQLARVLRMQGEFEAARKSYTRGGNIAASIGDEHSVLLSQIGHGVVLQKLGNLPESERVLREVIRQARRNEDRDAEARACHDLGGTLYFAGRARDAIPLAYRAFELHQSPLRRARALSDTGSMLKEIGCYSAAGNAFSVVLSDHPTPEVRAHTVLEMLELSAQIGDRVSFERWRQELAQQRGNLTQDQKIDLEIKLGTGFGLFGQLGRAERHLSGAVELAENLGMGERLFFAERMLNDIKERRTADMSSTVLSSGLQDETGVQDTIASLELLVADAVG
ncbi:MAG: tetratricopeptide repeat protein [Gemmatimonadota bacterium]|nr:MAG: tetratricopeptide repeat protein [Gemmatimonadota bacterium]